MKIGTNPKEVERHFYVADGARDADSQWIFVHISFWRTALAQRLRYST